MPTRPSLPASPEADPILDPARLERALTLAVARTGQTTFTVTGGALTHHVAFYADGTVRCDCADRYYRPEYACKHILACLFSVGQTQVLRAVAEHLQTLHQRTRAAERQARRAARQAPRA